MPTRHVALRDLPEPQRESLCLRLYREVFKPAFPLAAELEEPETWLDLISRNPPSPAPKLHVIAAIDEGGAIVGGTVCEFYRGSHAGLITYVAVAPAERRSGIGRGLIAAALAALARDAGSRQAPVFAEVERPDRAPPDALGAGIDLRARLRALHALGFAVIDIPYVQPALAQGKPSVDWLWLLVHRSSISAGTDSISATRVRVFLDEFFRSLGADPASDESFAKMAAWLDAHPAVALQALAQ